MSEFGNKIFTVTEISSSIKEMLEGVLNDVRVEGEISGLKKAASGHIYFDIKDENALISAVLFKGYALRTADLKDGLKVLVRGDLSCYIKQGRYQIIVKSLVPTSVGDLYLEFERLKQKLAAEGIFDEERKRPLPEFASRIGVVTSPTGAALQDILSVLKRRSPNLEVIISPSLVQGQEAPAQIVKAIERLNKINPAPDVILVGRGGGSMEDLWCFNDEAVARAIYKSKIPVVSCVGHETDFTIADFASDLRAPTPSAAAEIVAQNSAGVANYVTQLVKRMINTQNLLISLAQNRLNIAMSNKFLKDPLFYLNQREQETDDLTALLDRAFKDKIKAADNALSMLTHKLNALSPGAVLKRGFSIVRKQGRPVKNAEEVNKGDILDIELYKGNIQTEKI
ncbi:Exonuclease VII, large subunit [Elusimicrobium minutum Pei191]|uniref:Exodeoxyribonuclease 7 large subunit n=1 Tax=Elusimicrobium minutum (strain Pei191) TaxID=445932 RepID=B2KAR4_ELUMP|nr:exodeoxyribonuclease VII large subunit [Elusimicrobium minutum]ACC97610.1 Exonuclease VII, large subunit [Elusimicrobium minutum Pei191]